MTEADWITKHYSQIVGYKITGTAIDDSDNSSEPWIALVLEKGHKKKLAWILMDPEGNGVGHLDIVEEKDLGVYDYEDETERCRCGKFLKDCDC